MKILKYSAAALLFCAFSAHATGEQVSSCSAYGPNGSIPVGWALVRIEGNWSCGTPYGILYTWQNLNGLSRGATVEVCSLNNLPNWWPIHYIANNSGGPPCYQGGQYRYIVEYRGN